MVPLAFALALVLPAPAPVAHAQAAVIVGSWRGTSTCIDRAHYPACNDEVVIFAVRSHSRSGDTVTIRADKVVNGARELMSEDDFIHQPDGSWTMEIRAPRFHGRWTLRIAGDRMTGSLTDLAANRRAREVALVRAR